MMMKSNSLGIAVALGAVVLAAPSAQATGVGSFSVVEGTVETGRDGVWNPASAGASVVMGDEVKTGPASRAQLLFQDDSILSLAADSHLTIDEQVFDPDGGGSRSLFRLWGGRLNALVSEYYGMIGARYEIETPTAVCGVRGTEFLVSYGSDEEVTEVVVISGAVSVHGTVDATGPGVLVTANEVTTVDAGELPGEPGRMDAPLFQQRLRDFEFIGTGAAGNLGVDNAVAGGAVVLGTERVGAIGADVGIDVLDLQQNDASTLAGAPPAVIEGMGQLGLNLGQPK